MDRRSNAYAVMQAAIEATKSIDDKKLVDYMRANTFQVVAGDIKFGLDGEWARTRRLHVQRTSTSKLPIMLGTQKRAARP